MGQLNARRLSAAPDDSADEDSAHDDSANPASGGNDAAVPAGVTWPHALSHAPLLRVSDVMALVSHEFPALTTSKLRFLDSHGLVSPERTQSGYRQYSPADVERLRFVLRQQRDHYRPLGVIAEHLAALDSGHMHQPVVPHALDTADADYLSAAELAARAGTDTDMVATLEAEGVVAQGIPGAYPRSAVPVVLTAVAYLQQGGDLRTLRTLRNAASREVDHARNAAAPARSRGAGAEAHGIEEGLAEAAIAVFGACVRDGFGR